MYSVIIQNQNLMKDFQDYYPLFVELFQSGSIGCCTWVESGDDVATSLPGLTELIEGKKEWRAVIVRSQQAGGDGRFECSISNPYDFSYNSRENIIRRNNLSAEEELVIPVEESPIPLVRLTQMLGGVPSPELRFNPQTVDGDGKKVPRRIFVPEISEDDQKKYNELVHKYDFDGKAPTEILVITLRNSEPKSIREDTKARWETKKEIEDTSDFYRRNRYASCARFIVYDYLSQGKLQKDADLFNFWTSVMLLAREDIAPSSLQAYRLYQIKTLFDLAAMQECFQEKAEQLAGCKRYIDKEIRSELDRQLSENHPAPDYRMNVPVSVKMPENVSLYANNKAFDLCPESILEDEKIWRMEKNACENGLKRLYIQSERALDDSSDYVRTYSRYDDDEIKQVDKYDKREMELELSDTFDKIIHIQTELCAVKSRTNERTAKASEEVVRSLKERINKNTAKQIGICLLIGIALSCLPGFVFYHKYGFGGGKGIIFSTLFMFFFLLAALLLLLVWKRRNLNLKIRDYNKAMKENVSELSENITRFSDFVSNILSHSRGKNYLKKLETKNFETGSDIPNLQLHLSCVNKTLEKIRKWAESYNIPLIPEEDFDNDYPINYSVLPQNNTFYTFETGENYKIPLNDEGDHICSPFRFINGLTLEREELFKDE